MQTHANLHPIIWFDVLFLFQTAHTPYVSNSSSDGGVKGLFIHWNKSIFVNVLSLSDETRFEKCHLYAACCLITAKSNIVVEVAAGGPKPVTYLTKRYAVGKLAEYHTHKVAPCVETLGMFVRAMLFYQWFD